MYDKGTAEISPYQTFLVNILLIFNNLPFQRFPHRGTSCVQQNKFLCLADLLEHKTLA